MSQEPLLSGTARSNQGLSGRKNRARLICMPAYVCIVHGRSAKRRKLLSANRRAAGSIPLLRRTLLRWRLTTPQTATKLDFVAPPLWIPTAKTKVRTL